MICQNCNSNNAAGAINCASCGAALLDPSDQSGIVYPGATDPLAAFRAAPSVQSVDFSAKVNTHQQSVVQAEKNSKGTTGFVLSLLGYLLSGVPFMGWILWVAGAVCSGMGLRRKPRGLAIAGMVLSCIGLALFLVSAILSTLLFAA